MPKPVKLHPAAMIEAAAARAWYAQRSTRAAQRFDDELHRAITRMAERPESFPVYLANTRRCLLKRYPFLLVFRELPDRLQVLAVAHGRRRPGYWQGRMK
jgi:plasmid stabilization system protein ParE